MEIKKHFCSFSEAIREGAKLRPQVFCSLIERNGTCAIGAGAEAITLNGMDGVFDLVLLGNLEEMYPYLLNSVKCPAARKWWQIWKIDICYSANPKAIRAQIEHLNDFHKWTRESIADWLELEEEKLGYVTLTEKEETHETKTVAASAGDHALQLS